MKAGKRLMTACCAILTATTLSLPLLAQDVEIGGKILVATVDLDSKVVEFAPPGGVIDTGATNRIEVRALSGSKRLSAEQFLVQVTGAPTEIQAISGRPFVALERCTNRKKGKGIGCPAIVDKNGVPTALVNNHTLYFRVWKDGAPTEVATFSVYIRRPIFGGVAFSGGLAFTGMRDEQYKIEPTTTSCQSKISRLDDGDEQRPFVGIATWRIGDWVIGPSIGLGGGLDKDDFKFLAGGSLALTSSEANSGLYLTLGVVFGKTQQLAPEFHGIETVPNTTQVSSITKAQDDRALFVAISFGSAGNSNIFGGFKRE
jgi:hypothetical protein